jgi:hypothetical protein
MVRVRVGHHQFLASRTDTDRGNVVVLLRPEEVTVDSDGAGRVSGAVTTKAFFGDHYELTVETPLGLFRPHVTAAIEPKTRVSISWPQSAGIAYRSNDDV